MDKGFLEALMKNGHAVKIILQGGYTAVGFIRELVPFVRPAAVIPDYHIVRVDLVKADGSMRQKKAWFNSRAIIGVEEI